MNKFLFSIILFLIPLVGLSASNITNVDFRVNNGQVFGSRNLVKNPNCRLNAANITAASVSMTANTTSAPLDGISDCMWNPSATAQEISWAVDTMPTGVKNGNCEAVLKYSGDASLISFFVRNSSGPVANGVSLTNANNSLGRAAIRYPCSDGTAVPVLRSTGDAANVQYSIYTGEFVGGGTATVNTPFVSYASTAGLSGLGTGSATVNYAEWARSGPNILIRFRVTKDGSGGSGSTSVAISVPAGITIAPRITANYFGGSAGSGVTTNGNFELYYDTSANNIKFLQNDSTTFVGSEFSSGASVSGFIEFPVNGWETGDTVVNPSLPTQPTVTRLISGTTYTTPVGATMLEVDMCGAGGGGGGSGTALSAGSNGTNTTFTGGGATLTAGGGSGGPGGIGYGGAGGTVTITGVADAISMPGSYGQAGTGVGTSATYATGGAGGNSPLYAGGGGGGMAVSNGQAGTANTGGGAAGGGVTNAASAYAGTGGGSGGCIKALIKNPTTAYTISVGSGGNGGAAGTSGAAGGRGADGIINIREYYQGMNAPVLIGSVTSLNQSSAIRHEAAAISCTSSSSVVRQTASSFISTIGNISAGACILTFGTAWAVAPICTISRDSSNDPDQFFAVNGATTTGITTDCDVSGGADCTSYNATVICTGTR